MNKIQNKSMYLKYKYFVTFWMKNVSFSKYILQMKFSFSPFYLYFTSFLHRATQQASCFSQCMGGWVYVLTLLLLSNTLRLAWVKAASAVPTALTEENTIQLSRERRKLAKRGTLVMSLLWEGERIVQMTVWGGTVWWNCSLTLSSF